MTTAVLLQVVKYSKLWTLLTIAVGINTEIHATHTHTHTQPQSYSHPTAHHTHALAHTHTHTYTCTHTYTHVHMHTHTAYKHIFSHPAMHTQLSYTHTHTHKCMSLLPSYEYMILLHGQHSYTQAHAVHTLADACHFCHLIMNNIWIVLFTITWQLINCLCVRSIERYYYSMHFNVLLSIFAVFYKSAYLRTCSPVIGSVTLIWACIPSRLWNCPQSGLSNWNQTDKILGSIGTLSMSCNCPCC